MPILEIKKMGINGEGIGFERSIPVFVYGGISGDTIEYKPIEVKPNIIRGKLIRIIKPSSSRCASSCMNHGPCEGCPWIMTKYEDQLKWKEEEVKSRLLKVGVSIEVFEPIHANPNPIGYRNTIKLPIMMDKGKLQYGMYKRNSNQLVPIEHCVINEEGLNRVSKEVLEVLNQHQIQAYKRKERTGLRSIFLRGVSNKYQLCLVGGKERYSKECIDDLMGIEGMNSIYQNIQTIHNPTQLFGKQMIHLAGTKSLSFTINKKHFCLSLSSFFQMNTAQADELYKTVMDCIPEGIHHCVEAYCGIGMMSYYASDRCEKVTGIELVGSAIRDAKVALQRNSANNLSFMEGDSALELEKIVKKEEVDLLLVDPPRTGLDKKMIQVIQKAKIPHIIYVSCNPYTLGKNIEELNDYEVTKVIPFDLFSQTPHVETIVTLKRKEK